MQREDQSKLNKLIQELCPNGVEYKTLGEVTHYVNERIDRSKIDNHTYVGVENLLQNKGGKTDSLYVPDVKNFIYFKKNDVLIGNIRPYLKKVWLAEYDGGSSPDVLVIRLTTQKLAPDFLFYCLSSDSFFAHDMQFAKGAKMPRGDKEAIMQFPIPVPPLPVQSEIVRILDAFTALTAELTEKLTAELTARRKQYEYYRDRLLNFDDLTGGGIWIKISDIGSVSMCKRILKHETSSEGDVPFYKIGTFGKEPDAYISWETYEKYKSNYSYPKKGDILISAAGTIGRTVVFDGEPAYFQDSNIVWVDNDETMVLNKFLYYFYQTNPWKVSTGGTIARLYNDNIASVKIPLPPLSEQRRIVSILDRFDALCNDLTQGLPAEIAARRKQYEFYRDRLLDFQRKV